MDKSTADLWLISKDFLKVASVTKPSLSWLASCSIPWLYSGSIELVLREKDHVLIWWLVLEHQFSVFFIFASCNDISDFQVSLLGSAILFCYLNGLTSHPWVPVMKPVQCPANKCMIHFLLIFSNVAHIHGRLHPKDIPDPLHPPPYLLLGQAASGWRGGREETRQRVHGNYIWVSDLDLIWFLRGLFLEPNWRHPDFTVLLHSITDCSTCSQFCNKSYIWCIFLHVLENKQNPKGNKKGKTKSALAEQKGPEKEHTQHKGTYSECICPNIKKNAQLFWDHSDCHRFSMAATISL